MCSHCHQMMGALFFFSWIMWLHALYPVVDACATAVAYVSRVEDNEFISLDCLGCLQTQLIVARAVKDAMTKAVGFSPFNP